MAERHDGGPAFPQPSDYTDAGRGMSIRDWFAGQALIGIYLADSESRRQAHDEGADATGCGVDALAEFAYQQADAMLAQRSKL